jgi:hypothetical protein
MFKNFRVTCIDRRLLSVEIVAKFRDNKKVNISFTTKLKTV